MLARIWTALIVGVIAIAGVGAVKDRSAPAASQSASTNATVNVLPITRSITVSPGDVTFSHCHGGSDRGRSTPAQLGYPSAVCLVGTKLGSHGSYPVTVDNTGIPAQIEVSASDAVPSDHGKRWQLCGIQQEPACTGDAGYPGVNQFELWNAASAGLSPTQLTGHAECDAVFDPSGGCMAGRGQVRREGLQLIGPTSWTDKSLSFTITITWVAMPQ